MPECTLQEFNMYVFCMLWNSKSVNIGKFSVWKLRAKRLRDYQIYLSDSKNVLKIKTNSNLAGENVTIFDILTLKQRFYETFKTLTSLLKKK